MLNPLTRLCHEQHCLSVFGTQGRRESSSQINLPSFLGELTDIRATYSQVPVLRTQT